MHKHLYCDVCMKDEVDTVYTSHLPPSQPGMQMQPQRCSIELHPPSGSSMQHHHQQHELQFSPSEHSKGRLSPDQYSPRNSGGNVYVFPQSGKGARSSPYSMQGPMVTQSPPHIDPHRVSYTSHSAPQEPDQYHHYQEQRQVKQKRMRTRSSRNEQRLHGAGYPGSSGTNSPHDSAIGSTSGTMEMKGILKHPSETKDVPAGNLHIFYNSAQNLT